MAFPLPSAVTDQLIQAIAKAVWNRPEAAGLRESIEDTLKAGAFKTLTINAFETFAESIHQELPQFFDMGFISMPRVQQLLSQYITKGETGAVGALADLYADRFLKRNDTPYIQPLLEGYLKQLRETFATDPNYGDLLLARDVQGLQTALVRIETKLDQYSYEARKSRRPAPNVKPRVFISYAHGDGEQFASQLRERLLDKAIPLWQDRVAIEGGRDWWQQITEAIDNVEFMVLVMTPLALESDVIRREWRYARVQGVCVYPVKGVPDGELDYKSVPKWMRDVHWYDLDHEWQKLINDLNTRCEIPRVPFMVEDLPHDFVQRPEELDKVINKLLDKNREEPIAITAALRGAGGFGKTTLARAICHDEQVQQAFDDGILWVTLGEDPGDSIGRVLDLIETLSGERPGFTTLDAAIARFVELLEDRDILIVIDDLWNKHDARPFLQGGSRCARLITTRNDSVLPEGTHRVIVDAMQLEEAVNLLGAGIHEHHSHKNELQALASRLGEWALLLNLVKSVLQTEIKRNETLQRAINYVNAALDELGLTAFDDSNSIHDPKARNEAVHATLTLSLNRLQVNERDRLYELAVFPEDVFIPLRTVEQFWSETSSMGPILSRRVYERLYNFSLLLELDFTHQHLRLHDVIRQYLRDEIGENLPRLHRQLLDSYKVSNWANLSENEPYLWNWLAYHCIEARDSHELITAVKNLNYLANKTALTGSYSVEADLVIAEGQAKNDLQLRLLRRHYANAAHHFIYSKSKDDILNTLYWRLKPIEPFSELLSQFILNKPRLEPFLPLTDIPHPNLLRTFIGHMRYFNECIISYDDEFLVSTFTMLSLKIWDIETGQERFTLHGHRKALTTYTISHDNRFIVSGSADHTLKVWDVETGQELFTLSGHSDRVTTCAVSYDNRFIVSGSADHTLKVWDVETGQELFTLSGHSDRVTTCAVSYDNRFIVSGSADHTLKVWDVETVEEISSLQIKSINKNSFIYNRVGRFIVFQAPDRTLKVWDLETRLYWNAPQTHLQNVRLFTISHDNRSLVTVFTDGNLKVWSLETGLEKFTLPLHPDELSILKVSYNNRFIVAITNIGTIKVWNIDTGQEVFTIHTHTRTIQSFSISHNNRFIITTLFDGTLKLWEMENPQRWYAPPSHTDRIRECVVSHDDKWAISTSDDGTFRVWDVDTGHETFVINERNHGFRRKLVSDDGQFIIDWSHNRLAHIWDVSTRQQHFTFQKHFSNEMSSFLSDDGRFIITWSLKGIVEIWDIATKQQRFAFPVSSFNPRGFRVSLDGRFIAAWSENGTVKLWNTETGQERLSFQAHIRSLDTFTFSQDGRFMVGRSEDKSVKVWDVETGEERFIHHARSIGTAIVKISPDNNFIISQTDLRKLTMWDVETGQERFILQGHSRSINVIAISPDSRFMASGSNDNTIKVWNTITGSCVATFYTEGAVTCCAWFNHDYRIVAGSANGHIYFLRFVE